LRVAAALGIAAFVVHQARYALVPGTHAEAGHAYLGVVAPVLLAILLALALGRSLAGLAAGVAARPGSQRPLLTRWLASSAALLVLHVAQEGAERVIAATLRTAGLRPAFAAPLSAVPPGAPAPPPPRALAHHLAGRAPPLLG
jgi:hypothetical protein